MKNLCLFLIGISFSFQAFSQKKDTRLANLDELLEKVRTEWGAPGFAVAVVERDKIVYSSGFGYKDQDQKTPVTPNTLFAIGSSSKAFTSAVLGVLREDKKIDFDDRPAKYIPELRFAESYMNEQIIIKDLMAHRTGLPRHDLSWYMFPSDSDEELIKRIGFQEPFTGLRQQWYYNNWMFFLQGQIGKRITGKTWEENVQSMFFDKLGMSRSTFKALELPNDIDFSYGYQTDNEGLNTKMDYYNIAAMSPAGAINSSVTEMSNWLITWINGGKFGEEQVIPAAYVTEAMSAQMVVSAGVPAKEHPDAHFANYGYGWFLSSYRGHYRVEHGGNIDGFSASASFFPTDSLGIVVLANQNSSQVPGIVRNMIADRMLNLSPEDWSGEGLKRVAEAKAMQEKAKKEADSTKISTTKPSHVLAEYTGTYENPGYGKLELDLLNDTLRAKTGLYDGVLLHEHYDIFNFHLIYQGEISMDNPIKVSFQTAINGDISGLETQVEPALDPIEFKRTPKILDISVEDLAKYEGAYLLMGVQEVKIFVKEGKLYAFVSGQPEYEQIPVGNNEFNFKTLEGFKIKFEEKDGEIIAVNFVQPNGTFRGEKKK
jgi:CubicO group peptidase (beta-lactamase class C family)